MKQPALDWIWSALYGGYWKEVLFTILIIVAAWLAAQIYLNIIDKLILRLAGRTAGTLDDRIWRSVRIPGAVIILLIGIYGAIHRYQFRLLSFFDSVLFILTVCNVLYCAIKILAAVLDWYGEKISREREGETVARELLPLVDKVVKIVISGIGLIVVLDRYNIKIESVLVTLGVGSLAVGLALQDTLANMFGGFTIMLDRPFRIGDRIQLQSGEQGDVRSIGMRATTVMMLDGNLLVVPNSYLVKNMVINHSYPDARCRITLEVGVASDSNMEQVKKLMIEAACGNPKVLLDPAPSALMKSFANNWATIALTCFVKSYLDSGAVTDQINSFLNAAFKQAGIQMPFPTRIVHVVQEPKPSARLESTATRQ